MEYLLFEDFSTTSDIQLTTYMSVTSDDESYHTHNFYEIFYITEGEITHISEDIKEKLTVGDIVLLRKTDKHRFKREPNKFCAHRDIIMSEPLFVKACNFLNPDLINYIISSPKYLKATISKEKIIEFENIITEMNFLSNDDSIKKKVAVINSFAIQILTLFIQDLSQNEKKVPLWLKELLPRFENAVLLKKGLPAILEEVNYNYSYICRVFKKYMDCNMTEYLLNKRLNYAAYLLQLSNSTIENICNSIGIDSIPYFMVQFKKKYGLSPNKFRTKSKPAL